MNSPAKDLPARAQTAVDRIAQELRATALGREEGDFLGTEESLSAHFRVTAPTLRQAARLLEHEDVIRVKRGVHGGYFAARPDLGTISRIAATYLHGNLGSADDIRPVTEALMPVIIGLALRSPRLIELADYAMPTIPPSHAAMVEKEGRFVKLLVELADNPALSLVMAVFYQVGLSIPNRRDGVVSQGNLDVERERIALVQALLAGDRDRAIDHGMRRLGVVHGGIKRNLQASKAAARNIDPA